MKRQPAPRNSSSSPHRRIIDAAVRSYRDFGYRKTTVADVARGASMSSANVYRFFLSRRALEEAVVAELLEETFMAAATAVRRDASALQRLAGTFRALSQVHDFRVANDTRLHELVAAAVAANWPVSLAYADRVRGVVRSIIAAGQASGELRPGNPTVLTCCLLEAMDTYVNPSQTRSLTVRPTFEEMMKFCMGALRYGMPLQLVDVQPDLRRATVYQS
ncbi:TetR/AcrR family transcriptional regulator [Bradyrhizobium sp. UFLA05-112]